QTHVFVVPVVAIVGVAAELQAPLGGVVLELPPVVVEVVALYLVRGRCRAPEEAIGKLHVSTTSGTSTVAWSRMSTLERPTSSVMSPASIPRRSSGHVYASRSTGTSNSTISSAPGATGRRAKSTS